jgi:hypothetical protein
LTLLPGCGGVVSCCMRCSRVVLFASTRDVQLLSFLNDIAVLLLSFKKTVGASRHGCQRSGARDQPRIRSLPSPLLIPCHRSLISSHSCHCQRAISTSQEALGAMASASSTLLLKSSFGAPRLPAAPRAPSSSSAAVTMPALAPPPARPSAPPSPPTTRRPTTSPPSRSAPSRRPSSPAR